MDARARFVLSTAILFSLSAIANAADATASDFLSEAAPDAPAAVTFDESASGVFQPRWTGRLGAVVLQRGRPNSTPYVVTAAGAPIVDPANFIFPFQSGADVALMRHGDQADLDFRYFGVNQWTATQPKVIAGPGAMLAIPGFGGSADPVSIAPTYRSCLNSVEINLRQNISARWTVLGGFRYVSLHDNLFAQAVDQTTLGLSNVIFRTSNHLYGLQTGVDGILWDGGGRFRIEGVAKAGLYGNAATSNFGIDNGAVNFFSLNSSRSRPAFIGDLNFTGVYQLNDAWSLRAGYQLLWLSGVALASQQLPSVNPLGPSIQTNTVNGAFFHGAMLGVERSW